MINAEPGFPGHIEKLLKFPKILVILHLFFPFNRKSTAMMRILAALIVLLTSAAAGPATAADAEGRMILAVHPYLPFQEIRKRFDPLADYLSTILGRNVDVRVGRSYKEHLARIGGDKADIAFVDPAAYVELSGRFGRKPLLARLEVEGRPVFKGVIATREDSPITDLQDLMGRRFAFGDVFSTMAHLLPRYLLQQAGVRLEDFAYYRFLGSSTNVALGVLAGDFDAGGMKEEVFREFQHQGLRPLTWTPELSEHLFVAGNHVPAEQVEKLRSALLRLHHSTKGKRIIQSIKQGASALVPVRNSDYDNLRAIFHKLARDSDP